MLTALRVGLATLALAAIGQQLVIHIGASYSVLNFFSYFTNLSNILVALALTGPALSPDSRLGRWSASEGVRAAVALYIVVVGVVYHFLLHPYWNPTGWSLVVNLVLHYVMPAAFVLDWLWLTPKGRLRWIDPVKWLAFPLIYGGWTLIHGLATHWWPYGFVDVDALGLGRVVAIFGGLLVFFLMVGLGLVGLDRVFGRTGRDSGARAA